MDTLKNTQNSLVAEAKKLCDIFCPKIHLLHNVLLFFAIAGSSCGWETG